MAGLGIQTRGTGIAKVQRQNFKKGGSAFPDLNKDGKITRADVLKGRGVFKKGGMSKSQNKVSKVMREFKKGELHSGKKGPVVKSRKQAIAIALSEAGKSKKK
jgi:ribosomal protein L21E